jgi:hypothetical protein
LNTIVILLLALVTPILLFCTEYAAAVAIIPSVLVGYSLMEKNRRKQKVSGCSAQLGIYRRIQTCESSESDVDQDASPLTAGRENWFLKRIATDAQRSWRFVFPEGSMTEAVTVAW